MTASLISILSILVGVVGAIVFAKFFAKYTMGFTGNIIAGVFGSIFFIKSFGRLGFDPNGILDGAEVSVGLLAINFSVSFIGGGIALFLAKKIYQKMN